MLSSLVHFGIFITEISSILLCVKYSANQKMLRSTSATRYGSIFLKRCQNLAGVIFCQDDTAAMRTSFPHLSAAIMRTPLYRVTYGFHRNRRMMELASFQRIGRVST